MEKEEWKPIPNYEGLYEVSSLGRVKSLKFGKEKILSQGITRYRYVILSDGKKRTTRRVHQLVAEAFLNHTPCGLKLVIDHINDIKTDNRLENLQIITHRENTYKTQDKYTSKYRGVTWNKASGKWRAYIYTNGKSIHLGFFNCELTASIAYQNKLKT